MISKYARYVAVGMLSLMLMPNVALAQTQTTPAQDQGGYIGFGLGASRINIEEISGATSYSLDDQGSGAFVYAGSMVDTNVGIEFYYADLGDYDLNVTAPSSSNHVISSVAYGIAARFMTNPAPSGVIGFSRLGFDFGEPSSSSITFEGGSILMVGLGVAFPVGNAYWTIGADFYGGSAATLIYVGGHIPLATFN